MVNPGSTTFYPRATVVNGMEVDILLEEITVDLTFPSGPPPTVHFPITGVHLQAGATASWVSAELSVGGPPTSAVITRFADVPNDRPACRVTSP